MSKSPVLVDKTVDSGRVWVVTINRPHARNAVDGTTAALLAEAFAAFEKDETACVAVLTGAGGNFCAGADLKAVAAVPGSTRNPLTPVQAIGKAAGPVLDQSGPMGISRLLLSKPVIAAVSGFAVAGGLELACWCDIRVADETAVFGVFCRRFGVPLIDGGTVRLPLLLGHSRAMDMILTGRPVGAKEALEFGLVNRVVVAPPAPPASSVFASAASACPSSAGAPFSPSESGRGSGVLSAAIQLASSLASLPQQCMRLDRLSVYHGAGKPIYTALAGEFERGVAAVEREGVEGARRFAAGSGRHGEQRDLGLASKL